MTKRVPPHAPDVERGVLGCIFMDPSETMSEMVVAFGSATECFYDLRNRLVYGVLLDMHQKRHPIDTLTVYTHMRDAGTVGEIGGVAYLNDIASSATSTANFAYYLSILQDKFGLRRVLEVCTQTLDAVYSSTGTAQDVFESAERGIMALRNQNASDTVHVSVAVQEAISEIEANYEGKLGIVTGYRSIDRATLGFRPGDMVVVAARPSAGKTAWILNLIRRVVVDGKMPAGIFSIEMTRPAIIKRLASSIARVDMLKCQQWSESDFARVTSAMADISASPLHIDDRSAIPMGELRSKARNMVCRHGAKILFVDYLQIIRASTKSRDSRQVDVSEIAEDIKALAKELRVPIVIAAQLNRENEKTQRKPRMDDIRESGAIEANADFIGLLYRATTDDAQREDEDLSGLVPVNMRIAKVRDGLAGFDVRLMFEKRFQRIEEISPIDEGDIP